MTRPALWRNRSYLLIWSGQTVSAFGSSVSGIAIPLLVLETTHSPAAAGVAGAVRAAPYVVVSLPAGAIVERLNLRMVMVMCDAGRLMALTSIAAVLLVTHGHAPLIQIYAVTAIEGSLFVFYDVASFAVLPRIVASDQYGQAIAQNEASYYAGAGLFGSLTGGVLYQVGRAVPFAADALSYLVSVVSLLFVHVPSAGSDPQNRRHLATEVLDGVRWMWGHALIRTMSILYGADSLVSPGCSLLVIVLARQEHASAAAIGGIFSIGAIGGVIGSVVTGWTTRRFSFSHTVIAVRWLVPMLWPLYVFGHSVITLGVVTAVIYLLNPVINVAGMNYSVPSIPESLRARVGSVFQLIPSAITPLGLAAMGLLLQFLGPVTVALSASGYLCVLAIWVTANSSIRQAPRVPIAVIPSA